VRFTTWRRLRSYLLPALALCPAVAWAHTIGVSKSTFTADAGGSVDAEISLSVRDIARLVPLDRDGDGVVDEAEVRAHRTDFEGFVTGAVDVAGDGVPCAGTLLATTLGERGDGVDIRARYVCARPPAKLVVVARYMSAFDDTHRHAMSVVSATASKARVLTVTDREVSLDTGFAPPATPVANGSWHLPGVGVVIGVGVAAALAIYWRRRRGGGAIS
jgi:hypothetical protein